MIDRDVFEFYDQGWNAYMRGEPYNPNATLDWRDGWRDCRDAVDLGEVERDLNDQPIK